MLISVLAPKTPVGIVYLRDAGEPADPAGGIVESPKRNASGGKAKRRSRYKHLSFNLSPSGTD